MYEKDNLKYYYLGFFCSTLPYSRKCLWVPLPPLFEQHYPYDELRLGSASPSFPIRLPDIFSPFHCSDKGNSPSPSDFCLLRIRGEGRITMTKVHLELRNLRGFFLDI